jgi:hypothetical protein
MQEWHIKQETAVQIAQQDADTFGIPQTVFRNADTCGWTSTNPFAPMLTRSEVSITMLPTRYFQ